MIDQLNEWKHNCDRSALSLWTSAGLLLAWDTFQTLRHGRSGDISVASQWGLYLSAAAAVWTVNAQINRSTKHVSTQLNRFETRVGRLETRMHGATDAWSVDGQPLPRPHHHQVLRGVP